MRPAFAQTGFRFAGTSKIAIAVILSIFIFALTGCRLTREEVAGPPILNGNWASTDGVFTAQFRNGSFVATANDTGGVISEGEYVALASDRVNINWVGRVSGQPNNAQCVKPDPNRLDCTDSAGAKFSLQRTG